MKNICKNNRVELLLKNNFIFFKVKDPDIPQNFLSKNRKEKKLKILKLLLKMNF